MILAISGKSQSGKDTVGKIIQYLTHCRNDKTTWEEWQLLQNTKMCDWKIKKFADKLKDIVCLLIGCTREQLENESFKNTELGEEWLSYKSYKSNYQHPKLFINYEEAYKYSDELPHNIEKVILTPRLLLQLLGTECGRNIIHPNIWVNSLMSDYKPISNIKTSNIYNDERLQHGYKNTKIWRTYHNIKQRCNNPKHPRYIDYGERGIKMCEEWENSIITFINWAKENGYNDNLTIDRIDNDKNYSPNNCRCVSYSTQAINTKLRRDNTSGYKGVSKDKHNWRASIQINKKQHFLGYFDTAEEASWAYEEKFLERENLYEKQEEKELIYPSWLVTDLRFPNEFDAVKERNGISIRVNREIKYQVESLGGKTNVPEGYFPTNQHPSETALDNYKFDYVIDNNDTIEELIEKVRQILVKEKII